MTMPHPPVDLADLDARLNTAYGRRHGATVELTCAEVGALVACARALLANVYSGYGVACVECGEGGDVPHATFCRIATAVANVIDTGGPHGD